MMENLNTEELIQRIKKLIILRSKNHFNCSIRNENFDFNEKVFLNNYWIRIEDVDPLFLNAIIEHKESNWVSWFYKAYNYSCKISFHLSFDELELIPDSFLSIMPIEIFTKDEKKIKYLKQSFLTYKDVATLSDKDCILLRANQKITDFAQEKVKENRISVYRRMY